MPDLFDVRSDALPHTSPVVALLIVMLVSNWMQNTVAEIRCSR